MNNTSIRHTYYKFTFRVEKIHTNDRKNCFQNMFIKLCSVLFNMRFVT